MDDIGEFQLTQVYSGVSLFGQLDCLKDQSKCSVYIYICLKDSTKAIYNIGMLPIFFFLFVSLSLSLSLWFVRSLIRLCLSWQSGLTWFD